MQKLVHAGVYGTQREASVAHDIMRIMLDRRFGLVTMPEKLNHHIDSYDVVVSREEARALRRLEAAAIATHGGPAGAATMSSLNRLRGRVGRVVVLRFKRILADDAVESVLKNVSRRFFNSVVNVQTDSLSL